MAPRGETPSIHESRHAPEANADLDTILGHLTRMDDFASCQEQSTFDASIGSQVKSLGSENVHALSVAYFEAVRGSLGRSVQEMLTSLFGTVTERHTFPRLMTNVLNGGRHAYTNPVLSDFPEFLLVAQCRDVGHHVACMREIAMHVREGLAVLPLEKVGGNYVHRATVRDNRVWLDFLLRILVRLGLTRDYTLMIDASAGDLFAEGRYGLAITDGRRLGSAELLRYWFELLDSYPIQVLEDPFAETDADSWSALTSHFPDRLIAADNFCATDAHRIDMAAGQGQISAVLIKPSQAVTLTASAEAIRTATRHGLSIVPSHRSMETANTLLSDLCWWAGADLAKLGLLTDYATVLKLNRLLDLSCESNPEREPAHLVPLDGRDT